MCCSSWLKVYNLSGARLFCAASAGTSSAMSVSFGRWANPEHSYRKACIALNTLAKSQSLTDMMPKLFYAVFKRACAGARDSKSFCNLHKSGQLWV